MSLGEAILYRRRFFEAYPGLERWHGRERRAWQRGDRETRTLTGRCRTDVERLTDRLNTPVQSDRDDDATGLSYEVVALEGGRVSDVVYWTTHRGGGVVDSGAEVPPWHE